MSTSIYPTYNLPTMAETRQTAEQRIYKPAPMFDFESGDFVRDGAGRLVFADGREAYAEWCLKQCVTERNTRLAYSDKIGVEIDKAAKLDNIAAIESAIEKTITEALMVHPATEYVRSFTFKWNGADSIWVSFVVKGRDWNEQTLTVQY